MGGATSSSGSASSSGMGGAGGAGGTGGGGQGPSLAMFTQAAATSICGALYRCCDAVSMEVYFAPYLNSPDLAAFQSQIPPNKDFADEAECRATVKAMLDVVPFGDWVAQATAGNVAYDAAAMAQCLSALDGAACGDAVNQALYDSTCLGFAPPAGGAEQRKTFHRTQVAGDTCHPIFDGTGARVYGTCDPTQFFCCYNNPATPGKCAGAVDINTNMKRTGTCKAVSATGQPCYVNVNPLDFQVCATGSACGFTSDTCIVEGTGALQLGQDCLDPQEFVVLGSCQNSYCDDFNTGKCVAKKADGMACLAGYECANGGCTCPDPLDYQCPTNQRKCSAPPPYCAMP